MKNYNMNKMNRNICKLEAKKDLFLDYLNKYILKVMYFCLKLKKKYY